MNASINRLQLLSKSTLARPRPTTTTSTKVAFSTNRPTNATALGVGTPRISARAPTKYGGVYTVTLIPGDGIGKEITSSVKEIFEHTNAPIEFEEFNISGETLEDQAVFQRSMDSLRRNRVGLKGVLYTPSDDKGHPSWNVAMRQQLDIYASISCMLT
ncbi:isocitrate dehydrogenase (NAD(+)) idh1 [Puccinia graminis f. sp. tritici]|uniref:Isocitrate dehydrogenase (NAD(+)) idh1 n=1 Tax=Puccinia graminis f. sp. tritici TaxID=56615 RepID=A0A5B0MZU9_PUCGR|nr:isocitrate dehydrogenase (NAD(+)) idh1 [Puccinia graminis f. sp. tritici]